jgi:hypothetical protein
MASFSVKTGFSNEKYEKEFRMQYITQKTAVVVTALLTEIITGRMLLWQ